MTPGRSLSAKTSGPLDARRSRAPPAWRAPATGAGASAWRGAARQMIGRAARPGSGNCGRSSRRRWCAAAACTSGMRRSSAIASRDPFAAPACRRWCSPRRQQRAAELGLLVGEDDARAGCAGRERRRQTRQGRRRRPARRNGRASCRSGRDRARSGALPRPAARRMKGS